MNLEKLKEIKQDLKNIFDSNEIIKPGYVYMVKPYF